MMKRTVCRASLILCLIPSLPAFAAQLTVAGRAWIAARVDQLKLEKASKRSVQKYGTCMLDYFEDNARVTQSEMEHLFPPARRACNSKTGWK
jgi:hypothetical protein